MEKSILSSTVRTSINEAINYLNSLNLTKIANLMSSLVDKIDQLENIYGDQVDQKVMNAAIQLYESGKISDAYALLSENGISFGSFYVAFKNHKENSPQTVVE